MENSVTYARIDWQQGTVPRSEMFDDCYFSVAGGKEETLHNFIGGNRIMERLARLPQGSSFVIAETGFGTGSNLWVLCEQLRSRFGGSSDSRMNITFISFEKYPLTPEDLHFYLTGIYRVDPTLFDLERFLSEYRSLKSGENRFTIVTGERIEISLILYIGDLNDTIGGFVQSRRACVNAWFLDGFAPSKNAGMWSPVLFNAMRQSTAAGGTFATFTVAGSVRRGLAAAGFEVRKIPGCGLKREILAGQLPDNMLNRGDSPLHCEASGN